MGFKPTRKLKFGDIVFLRGKKSRENIVYKAIVIGKDGSLVSVVMLGNPDDDIFHDAFMQEAVQYRRDKIMFCRKSGLAWTGKRNVFLADYYKSKWFRELVEAHVWFYKMIFKDLEKFVANQLERIANGLRAKARA